MPFFWFPEDIYRSYKLPRLKAIHSTNHDSQTRSHWHLPQQQQFKFTRGAGDGGAWEEPLPNMYRQLSETARMNFSHQ